MTYGAFSEHVFNVGTDQREAFVNVESSSDMPIRRATLFTILL